MSVAECQERITSREFTEWIAFYLIADDADDREPTPDELGVKLAAWAAHQNALATGGARSVTLERAR